MDSANRKSRLSSPLMFIFRAAHEAKDAKKKIDVRNEAGERIIASRRLRPRQVIDESLLRREVARDLTALLNTVAMEFNNRHERFSLCAKVNLEFRDSGRDPPIDRRGWREPNFRRNQNGNRQF